MNFRREVAASVTQAYVPVPRPSDSVNTREQKLLFSMPAYYQGYLTRLRSEDGDLLTWIFFTHLTARY